LLSSLESENEWKISCDKDDDNIAFSAKSDNSFEVFDVSRPYLGVYLKQLSDHGLSGLTRISLSRSNFFVL